MMKWRGLAARLETAIASGELAPGDGLPSEAELVAAEHVSRNTVRLALGHLASLGLITGQAGQRRHVAVRELLEVHVTRTATRLGGTQVPTEGADSWLADVAAAGHVPGEQLWVRHVPAGRFAARLGLGPEDAVVAREMLRTVDGHPHNAAVWAFPVAVARGTVLEQPGNITGGSVPYLERTCGPLHYRIELEPRMPSSAQATALVIPQGVALAVEYRTGLRPGSDPVFVSETLWPGDRARLILEL